MAARNTSILVRVFVSREDGGEGIGGGEDFWREIEEALDGAALFGEFAGGFGLGFGGAGEVFVPALHIVVQIVVVSPPAGGITSPHLKPRKHWVFQQPQPSSPSGVSPSTGWSLLPRGDSTSSCRRSTDRSNAFPLTSSSRHS